MGFPQTTPEPEVPALKSEEIAPTDIPKAGLKTSEFYMPVIIPTVLTVLIPLANNALNLGLTNDELVKAILGIIGGVGSVVTGVMYIYSRMKIKTAKIEAAQQLIKE